MATKADPRGSHQPIIPPAPHDPVDSEWLHEECARLCALVLIEDAMGTAPLAILDDDPERPPFLCKPEGDTPVPRPLQEYKGEPVLLHTVRMLESCGFAHIEALVMPTADEDAAAQGAFDEVVRRIKDALAGTAASLIVADEARMAEAAERTADLSVFNMSAGVLSYAADLANGNASHGALLMPCDMVRIEPFHIAKLVDEFAEHPESDVVAAWITWFNRPPYLFRTAFLEHASQEGLEADEGDGHRGAPSIDVREVVLGEERLAATPVPADPEETFFKGCTLSALQAVRMVRAEQKASKKEAAATHSKSDALLLDAARKVLAVADEAWSSASRAEQDALDAADAWARRNRLDFPIFTAPEHANRLVYLDSAATTQCVGRSLDAAHHFDAYARGTIYRGSYPLSAQATAAYNDARKVLEDHIGSSRRQTIYTMNTSTAVALAASAWGERNIGEDDTILVAATEHHSDLLPWLMLAQRKDAHVKYIPYTPKGRLNMDVYAQLLELRPKLVCAAHISNVFGMLNPVKQMAEMAHTVGARMLVDAAQSFAHAPVNVKDLGCDFLCFSAHKAYGPFGLGGLWMSEAAYAEADPRYASGGTIAHAAFDSYYLQPGAIQYEMGTPPISQAIGFAAAIEYLDRLGMEAITTHGTAMCHFLLAALEAMGGITVWGDHAAPDGSTGLISFTQADVRSSFAATTLGKLGVCVRAGGHCALPLHASMGLTGTIRFSMAAHTTREDLEAALVALEVCRRIYNARVQLR